MCYFTHSNSTHSRSPSALSNSHAREGLLNCRKRMGHGNFAQEYPNVDFHKVTANGLPVKLGCNSKEAKGTMRLHRLTCFTSMRCHSCHKGSDRKTYWETFSIWPCKRSVLLEKKYSVKVLKKVFWFSTIFRTYQRSILRKKEEHGHLVTIGVLRWHWGHIK